ncbi:MAG: hypothetical protein HC812_18575 [Leptolyngbya sp. RL_3_1]|nr:hypothetical protein [Leptolyngbya sp. RL_3_1]
MFGLIEIVPLLFVGLILKLLVDSGQPPAPAPDPEAAFKKALAEYLAK